MVVSHDDVIRGVPDDSDVAWFRQAEPTIRLRPQSLIRAPGLVRLNAGGARLRIITGSRLVCVSLADGRAALACVTDIGTLRDILLEL